MTIKAVLFDWDGTLYDIVDFIIHTYGQVMREKGIREWSRQEYKEKFKIDWHETLKDMGLEEHEDYLLSVWKKNMEEMKDDLSLYDEAKATMIKLSEKYIVGVVSSAPKKALLKEIKRLSVKKHVKIIVSKNDVSETKPSPQPLLLAAKRLKLKPGECVYVGDMIEDVEAAKKARMPSIAVSWGLHSKKILAKENPDYIADNFSQIIEYISKIR